MTYIPIMVKVMDDVVPDASIDRECNNKVFTTCFNCGGLYFYQVVQFNFEGAKLATDTMIYCAQCGECQGGIINDPLNEVQSLSESTKREEKE